MKHTPSDSRTILGLLWLTLVFTAFATRSYFPLDETRYVGVAWEMWLRGDFLVPYLNGEPYSHKPPLLFWLFQAGWWLFGVNEWWPRLVPELCALANLLLTARLARRLWPAWREPATLAPLILLGSLLWTFYTTMTMFDMLVVTCTLIGMLGVLRTARGQRSGWLLLGLAIGLGILSKGPVILLHTLPAALLAPLWLDRAARPARWSGWYAGLLGALLQGAFIGLAWALPAAHSGGNAYARMIFWSQTATRMGSDAAPHSRPLWWYLPLLLLLLFPWSLWPPLWRGMVRLRRAGLDSGARFCLAWSVPVFIAFSLISGKQAQYLLPLLPAAALLAARALRDPAALQSGRAAWPAIAGLLVAGGAIGAAHVLARRLDDSAWVMQVSPVWGLAVIGMAAILWRVRARNVHVAVLHWTLASVALFVIVHVGVIRVAMPTFDLHPISRQIAAAQRAGLPVAHAGNYHDQYQFLGRLQQPLTELAPGQVGDWANRHPEGRVVVYYDPRRAPDTGQAVFAQAYRGRAVALWSGAVLRAHPHWASTGPEATP